MRILIFTIYTKGDFMNRKSPFHASALLVAASGILFTATFAAIEEPYEVGTWGNFAKGAISHTFDDNMNTNPNAEEQKIYDEKGFHMSVCVQTNSCNWDNCKATFEKGHEISSHTTDHASSTQSFEQSQAAIKKNVPGEMCVTVAYPNCQQNGANTSKYFLAGRNCTGSPVNAKTPSNWDQINSQMFGSPRYGNSANDLNNYAEDAVKANGWSVYCFHGIGGQSHSWATIDLNAMKGHLDYLDENRDKIWIETFGNVARYIRERDAADVKEKSSDDNSFTVEVTDDLADSIFNYPLTLRRPLPDDWDEEKVTVTQNGDSTGFKVVTDGSDKFIQFEAVPDSGDVVIASGATATRHGVLFGKTPSREIVQLRNNRMVIATDEFSDSKISVQLFNLNGKLLARHVVSNSTHVAQIALTEDLTQSAFLVKITSGNRSITRRFTPQM